MKKYGLVSSYTVKQYKVHSTKCNEEKIKNIVNREFDRDQTLDVVVSDLTYVNVKGKWNYILHTDRGNEFKNKAIDQLLKVFSINRSLSKKGCPYDNAVVEAAFKVVKTEFAFNKIFSSFEELEY
ncbi:Integrase core domain-containing protein [Selenihalanaerobacter shriftii]|uniref:Integrase core domain-containing protein n=1 Tax=Selenihalanaerobacter shriftii TaxID=142842 RepID=A0A1T4NV60_9FIRM|nr:Integrase core domain-containing protein [Selenihalanaerobacter shriftii]